VDPDESAKSVANESAANSPPPPAGRDDPGIKAAIAQADEYFIQGKLDEAIEAYSTVMLIDSTNRDLNLKRGSVYLAKGDIEQAVIDYQLGGKPLPLPVTAESAKLKSGVEVKATVRRGQTLAITKITEFKGSDWLFVTAVDGNDAARGWIHIDAVTEQPAAKAVSQPATTSRVNQGTPSRYYPDNQNSRYRAQTPLQRLIEQGLQREQLKRQRLAPQRMGGRNRW
jgi:hypothetical protein